MLPSLKLKEKKRIGSLVQKRYNKPLTPAKWVPIRPDVRQEVKAKVCRMNAHVDPLALADEVVVLPREILSLAEHLCPELISNVSTE